MRLFFEFFFVTKGSPLQVFWYFAANWSFKKSKGSPLSSFLALWDCFKILIFRFFSKTSKIFLNFYSMSPKGPPFNFLIFCNRMDVQKIPKGALFYIFRHYATYRRLQKYFEKKFGKHFSQYFFSLFRHNATSFRQKKFRKGSAFIFSGVLRQNGCWKIPKGPPFSFFQNRETFFKIFSPKGPPFNFFDDLRQKGWKISTRLPGAPVRSNFWVLGVL